MHFNLHPFLLDIAREEAASKEAELQSLRNSLRYRVGGWILEAFPPGLRTFFVLWRLTKLYLIRLHGRGTTGKPRSNLVLSVEALQATTLMLGATLPDEVGNIDGFWSTENAELMALRLDSGPIAHTLILRRPSCSVLRRIARVKLGGAKVIWWPEVSVDPGTALVAHIRTHADQCRDEPAS